MINPDTMAVLRGVANTIISDDLKTEVTLMIRQRDSENAYGLSAESFTSGGTYLAWVVDSKKAHINETGELAGVVNELEVRLPLEAFVAPGDQIIIGGEAYTVQQTNNEHTLPFFMKAIVRLVE